jgi:hypothetical protein
MFDAVFDRRDQAERRAVPQDVNTCCPDFYSRPKLPGINRAVFGINLMATKLLLRGQRVSPEQPCQKRTLQPEAFRIEEELKHDP